MTENIENIQQENQPQQEQEVKLNDVLERKVNYFELDVEKKEQLRNEYIDSLDYSDEDKQLFREKGYVAEQMFGGKDRYANDVQWKNPEEFKRDFIDKRKRNYTSELGETKQQLSQVQREMEELKNLMKFQATSTIESQERDLAVRIEEARYEGDFDKYDELRTIQFELKQKKHQFSSPKQEEKFKPQPSFSSEEISAIDNFKYENAEFSKIVLSNVLVRETFDDFVKTTAKSNPNLHPKEVLKIAKELTERVNPDLAPKQKSNVYVNNQYSANSNTSFTKKVDSKPTIKFDQLSEIDKKFIQGATKNYPGKTAQQVFEILSSSIGKK